MRVHYLKKNIQLATLFLLIIVAASCSKKKTDTLTIAAASNMQFVIKEITKSFTQKTGIECQIIISSSGKLTSQIKEGAPFDVFVSADMKFPTELYKLGLTTSKPKVYAFGKLVLWTMDSTIEPSFEILSSNNIKHIAIANPKTAPYGIAAIEVLTKENLVTKIENKLVYGESVSQTNQFITTKSAEIGLTAMSVVVAPKMIGKGKWIAIDTSSYAPISQGIVILKNNPTHIIKAEKFYTFLKSTDGRNILTKFGYSVNN